MYEGTGKQKHQVSRLALGARAAAAAGRVAAPESAVDAAVDVSAPASDTLWTGCAPDPVPAAIRAAQWCGCPVLTADNTPSLTTCTCSPASHSCVLERLAGGNGSSVHEDKVRQYGMFEAWMLDVLGMDDPDVKVRRPPCCCLGRGAADASTRTCR